MLDSYSILLTSITSLAALDSSGSPTGLVVTSGEGAVLPGDPNHHGKGLEGSASLDGESVSVRDDEEVSIDEGPGKQVFKETP